MEEEIVLANVATVLNKDVLMDEPQKPSPYKFTLKEHILLQPSDDEDLKIYLKDKDIKDDFASVWEHAQQSKACDVKPQTSSSNKKKPTAKRSAALIISNHKKLGPPPAPIPPKLSRIARVECPLSNIPSWHYPDLNLMNKYTDTEFENSLHMRKLTYSKIFESLRDKIKMHKIPPHTVFSLAMWKLITDQHFEEISCKYQIPTAMCQQIIRYFWYQISENYESFIKWPNSLESQKNALEAFAEHTELKCFSQLFGIVAQKRFDIFLEGDDTEVPVIMQIVCDARGKIIDCFAELEKNYNFDTSPIGQTLTWNARTMPTGAYLIGDQGFPLKSYLMRPISVVCFRKDEIFNNMLKPAYKHAADVLDTMAKRFNILYGLEARGLLEVRQIIESISAFHNLCVDFNDDYVLNCTKDGPNKFNWAHTSSTHSNQCKGSEKDEKGLSRRSELMDILIDDYVAYASDDE